MKVLSVIAVSLSVVFALGYLIFDRIRPDYPVSKELINADGKILDCNIVGKTGSFLIVDRKSDNARFNVDVASLSRESKFFAFTLREQPAPSIPKYPILRSLKNAEGKSVSSYIIGRTGNTIYVTRRRDDERFEVEIDKLSDVDREFAKRLPERSPPPLETESDYVEIRAKLIEELEKKLGLYQLEVKSKTLNDILAKKRAEQVLEIKNEIKEHEVAIARYKLENEAK